MILLKERKAWKVKAYEEILNFVNESVTREVKIKVMETYHFLPILMKIRYHPELANA